MILEFLDAVGISKCVVVGHSIGGWIAQYIAADQPERVSKLVLVDSMGVDVPEAPATDLSNIDRDTFYGAVFTKMETVRVAGDFGDMPETVGNSEEFENEWKGREVLVNLTAGRAADPELTNRLSRITAPTLIVWGREDELVPLRHGEILAESIPQSTFVVIESDERQTAGHSPMRYRVETFNLIVRNFLVGSQEAPPPGMATLVKA
jgi:4,5:9,10-diseco-3-hydroxy-5,9,17-trioxoandrosta-1(10),2-diene-4-oate hydrolase